LDSKIVKKWVEKTIIEILSYEDEIAINYVISLLEEDV